MTTAATSYLMGIDPAEEAGWIQGIAKGDAICFRKLYERFKGVIFSTVYKVLGNREDTEDTAQEVFAQIWQKAHLFSPDRGKALTWVSTMARNRAIDRLRTKQRRYRLGETFLEQEAVKDQMLERDASDDAETNERARAIHDAMDCLTDDQRAALELVYFHGMTHAEAAERLGQPLGTIKARVRRGLARLRENVMGVELAA